MKTLFCFVGCLLFSIGMWSNLLAQNVPHGTPGLGSGYVSGPRAIVAAEVSPDQVPAGMWKFDLANERLDRRELPAFTKPLAIYPGGIICQLRLAKAKKGEQFEELVKEKGYELFNLAAFNTSTGKTDWRTESLPLNTDTREIRMLQKDNRVYLQWENEVYIWDRDAKTKKPSSRVFVPNCIMDHWPGLFAASADGTYLYFSAPDDNMNDGIALACIIDRTKAVDAKVLPDEVEKSFRQKAELLYTLTRGCPPDVTDPEIRKEYEDVEGHFVWTLRNPNTGEPIFHWPIENLSGSMTGFDFCATTGKCFVRTDIDKGKEQTWCFTVPESSPPKPQKNL